MTTMPPNGAATASVRNTALDRLIEQITDELQAGGQIDLEAMSREHPEHAVRLRQLVPALALMANLGQSADPSIVAPTPHASGPVPELSVLGDYRILREIGRGGMGVVYEALQLSLNRRVALKVLPFAAVADPKQLQRFRVEAQAAAQLHHTNIVPVHAVGCERGVHYYAMQYIEGETLAHLIDHLRQLDGPNANAAAHSSVPALELAGKLASGQLTRTEAGIDGDQPAGPRAPAAPNPFASTSSGRTSVSPSGSSTHSRAFFRNAARVGIQAAEALEHAHAQGVLHRDIKPANLMIDVQGNLWVTDFGLARLQSEAGLTMTGDVLGTLRYMSPEQALAKRVVIDQRTDIYSLGATLYELLTLHPVFEGDDRQALLRQIAFTDPLPLRRRNPAVARELETIVLKALAKEPSARYATAQELADDLRLQMEDKPIRARPPTIWDRTTKFVRRHTAAVIAASSVLFLAVVSLGIGIVLIGNEKAQTERERESLRWQLYVNRVNLAQREYDENVARTMELLDQCPGELRSWEWNYLARQCHLDLATVRGRAPSINGVVFSPDGKKFATVGGKSLGFPSIEEDAELILWDAATIRETRRFHGLKGSADRVVFSPDGRLIAVGSGYDQPACEGHLTLWDAATGSLLFDKTHYLKISSVAFSPDGKCLAAGLGNYQSNLNGRLTLWEIPTGRNLVDRTLEVSGGINRLAFSPDGKTIATASKEVVQLWRRNPLGHVRELRGHAEWIYTLAFSSDGNKLATGGWDRTIKVWNPETGQLVTTLEGHASSVTALAFSPDGLRLASASEDYSIRLWNARTGKLDVILRGHSLGLTDIAFSPDGQYLLSSSSDGTAKLWDASSDRGNRLIEHKGWVNGVSFSPDGRRLATGSGDGRIMIWDAVTGRRLLSLDGGIGWVNSVAFSPDGCNLVSAGEYNALQIWDAATGRLVKTVKDLDNFVRAVAYSPDGTLLSACTGAHDFRPNAAGVVYVWRASTHDQILCFRGHTGRVMSLAFSPDSKLIASAGSPRKDVPSSSNDLLLWESRTGQILHRLRGHDERIASVAFSRNGQWLASGSDDGEVRLWSVANGGLVHVFKGHGGRINSVVFSADGNRIVSGCDDKTIKLWDRASAQEVLTLRGHSQGVTGLAFSPEGDRLASGSIDWTAQIWDATPLVSEEHQDSGTAFTGERP